MKRSDNYIRKTGFVFLFIIIFLSGNALADIRAQNSTLVLFAKGLDITFEPSEMKKLEKAEELLGDADLLLQDAINKYGELSELELKQRITSSYNEALKKLFESSELSGEAYGIAFSVLREKSEDFWQRMTKENHRAAGMDKARYYESSALKTYNRSVLRRNQALESDRFEYSLEIIEDAVELEKLAIRNQGRAVQICQDFPVEYDYKWEDDPTLEEIVQIMKDPIVHEPPKDIFATVDEKTEVDSSLFKEIIFKVQIAAHTKPLSEDYLNLLYKGNLPIDMIFEEDWYKYSIGRYNNFEEADSTRSKTDINKAFVVAYREGKKISTQEARRIVQERNAIIQQEQEQE